MKPGPLDCIFHPGVCEQDTHVAIASDGQPPGVECFRNNAEITLAAKKHRNRGGTLNKQGSRLMYHTFKVAGICEVHRKYVFVRVTLSGQRIASRVGTPRIP